MDEVFRTDAPGGSQTTWRLFNGGVEYGALFNNGSDLHFEQEARTKGGHLRWRTYQTLFMQLLGLQSTTINGYSIDQTGYLGLGAPDNWDVTTPYSRIHLIDRVSGGTTNQCAPPEPFRDWMRNGITLSGNYDMDYIGQKYAPGEGSDIADDDHTDMILHWSNDTGEDEDLGPDRMRFLFTTERDATAVSGAQSEEGLEAIRLYPKSNSSVNVGIGDFYAYGLSLLPDPEPSEQLDILDRTIRIRKLIENYEDVEGTMDAVVVSDADGRLHWRDLTSLVGDDCDWTLQGPPGSNNSVSTAYLNNTGCPQEDQCVGIGVEFPKSKLHVYHDGEPLQLASSLGASTTSIHRSDYNVGIGVHGMAHTDLSTSFNTNYAGIPPTVYPTVNTARTFTGVLGTSGSGLYSFGVEGHAIMGNEADGAAKDVIGVVGRGFAFENAGRCVGVYGHAKGASSGNDWAGWFDGLTYCPLGVFSASDGAFKQNVQDLTSASDLLSALHPKSYEFDMEGYGFMGFSQGTHWGLMADEVEQTIPHMVKDALRPARYDAEGNLLEPEVAFKALNYQELSPLLILIAGHQEQQALIDEQREMIQQQAEALDAMQERLAMFEEVLMGCCSNSDGRALERTNGTAEEGNLGGGSDKLRIQPNPFSEPPTIFYTLDRSGRMQLIANSADGKELSMLQEATLQAGSYQYEWNTTNLAPGMYYVTLLMDGQPLVKKAVKVIR